MLCAYCPRHRYAYILTTAFSVGIAISAIIQFIVSDQSAGFPEWRGTDLPFEGCDGGTSFGCPRLEVPEEGFAPAPGAGAA